MFYGAHTTFGLAAKDLLSVVASREDFSDLLEPFAKRRVSLWAQPQSPLWGNLYWPGFAQTMAAVGSPSWLPMNSVLDLGLTLEGGAKGLRGFFTKEPSEKERKRVLKTATLAGRILEMVANADRVLNADESRLVAMAMNSFGLTAEELQNVRPGRALTFEDLEIFGDLDVKTRRALLRGAWQLAATSSLDPARELAVRGVAARLEVQAEVDMVRAEVLALQQRQYEIALVAVELVRSAARLLPPEATRLPVLHLVEAIAPSARKAELEAHALSGAPVQLGAVPKLDAPRKKQAIALAYTAVIAHDPALSAGYTLRVRITDDAIAAGCGSEASEAFEIVQRFLSERVREATASAQPSETAVVTVAQVEAKSSATTTAVAGTPTTSDAPEVETIIEDEPSSLASSTAKK